MTGTGAGRDPELIVAPRNDRSEPVGDLEGAGPLSSWSELGEAMPTDRRWDAGPIGFAASAAALDSLDVAMDPLGALGSAGVGWLIEHVEFLHEPLDWLAGDPAQITAQAHTWHNMSTELGWIAQDYRHSVQRLTDWDGAAAAAYRAAAGRYADGVRTASDHAEDVSKALSGTGAAVGTVRAMIRDVIADRVWELIQDGVVAAAAAGPTAGASVATFLTGAVARAAQTAADNSRRVAELLDRLSSAADRFSDLVRRFGATADEVRSGLGSVDAAPPLHGDFLGVLDVARSPAGRLSAGPDLLESDATAGIVELGKQRAEAEQQASSWDRDPD